MITINNMEQALIPEFSQLPAAVLGQFVTMIRSNVDEENLVTALEYLIDNQRININHLHRSWNAPTTWLLQMIHYEKCRLVDVLLARDVNVHLGNGISPIIKAVKKAAESASKDKMNYIIQKLVQKDPTVFQTRIGGKNLIYLSWSTNPDLRQIEFLLDLGFPVNMTNTFAASIPGYTTGGQLYDRFHIRDFPLLFFTIAHENTELMNLLIQRGANPDVAAYVQDEPTLVSPLRLVSPLHLAMEYTLDGVEDHDPRIMETLLRSGSDVDAKDERGRTCLYLAVRKRLSWATIDLLLQYGANVNTRCSMQWGNTSPMDIANPVQRHYILDVVRERRLRIWNQMHARKIPREIQETFWMPSL
jgi:hypothetical protein